MIRRILFLVCQLDLIRRIVIVVLVVRSVAPDFRLLGEDIRGEVGCRAVG